MAILDSSVRSKSIAIPFINGESSRDLENGDVVIIDTTTSRTVKLCTTNNSEVVMGVVESTNNVAQNEIVFVVVHGIATFKADGTISASDTLISSNTSDYGKAKTSASGHIIGRAIADGYGGYVEGVVFSSIISASDAHSSLTGLTTGDDHTQYVKLAGRSGGQTLIGGTDAGNDLTLQSTSNGTKGSIIIGTSVYDEVNNRLSINNTSPQCSLHVGENSLSLNVFADSNYDGISIVPNKNKAIIAIEGLQESSVALSSLSSVADKKIMQIICDGGQFMFRSIKDSGAMQYGSILTIDNGTGNVAIYPQSGSDSITFNDSVVFEVRSDSKPVMLPKVSTTNRDLLTPIAGMLLYNSTDNVYQYYNGSSWKTIATV